jgi:hypothetical protein
MNLLKPQVPQVFKMMTGNKFEKEYLLRYPATQINNITDGQVFN